MLARMVILEKIPQAFDSYAPPRGMNIQWYHDFEGKENENQVCAFITGIELSVDDSEICQDGDILKEVQNNRCFVYLKTVPRSEWATTATGFVESADIVSMPRDHPKIKPEWIPRREYEAEIDEAAFKKLNDLSIETKKQRLDTDPSKIRKDKGQDRKQQTKVTVPYVDFADMPREESAKEK